MNDHNATIYDTGNPQPRRRNWGWRTVARFALVAVTLGLVAMILWLSRSILTPFIIGLVLAYLLVPLVGKLHHRMPRWAAILVVYGVAFLGIGGALFAIVPPAATQINEAVREAPQLYDAVRGQVDRGIAWFNSEAPPEVRDQVTTQVDRIQATVRENATRYAQGVGEFLFNSVLQIFQTLTFLLGFLIIPFFLFYILMDSAKIPAAINKMLHPRIRDDWWNTLSIIDTVFGKYIRGQLILGVIVGVCSFVGLTALNLFGFNIRFTVLLAIIAGLGELIPVIGPILTAIPAVIVALTSGVDAGLWVAGLYVVIQQVENNLLVPRIVGDTLRVHAALLMALLVVAAQIGGLGLVILSPALTAIGRDLFVYYHQRLQEPPASPAAALAHVTTDAEPEDKRKTRQKAQTHAAAS